MCYNHKRQPKRQARRLTPQTAPTTLTVHNLRPSNTPSSQDTIIPSDHPIMPSPCHPSSHHPVIIPPSHHPAIILPSCHPLAIHLPVTTHHILSPYLPSHPTVPITLSANNSSYRANMPTSHHPTGPTSHHLVINSSYRVNMPSSHHPTTQPSHIPKKHPTPASVARPPLAKARPCQDHSRRAAAAMLDTRSLSPSRSRPA